MQSHVTAQKLQIQILGNGSASQGQRGGIWTWDMTSSNEFVLIVDDDHWTRKALASILRHHGWCTVGASTLAEGLERLHDRPSGIILDLSLPDGCGEAILREVRETGL